MRKSALLLTLVACIAGQAQDLKPIQLPTAQMDRGGRSCRFSPTCFRLRSALIVRWRTLGAFGDELAGD